jgi:hypothetical protein
MGGVSRAAVLSADPFDPGDEEGRKGGKAYFSIVLGS